MPELRVLVVGPGPRSNSWADVTVARWTTAVSISSTGHRRIVLAAASATLIGASVALRATAMAAPTTPQHTVTQTPIGDDIDDDFHTDFPDGDLDWRRPAHPTTRTTRRQPDA